MGVDFSGVFFVSYNSITQYELLPNKGKYLVSDTVIAKDFGAIMFDQAKLQMEKAKCLNSVVKYVIHNDDEMKALLKLAKSVKKVKVDNDLADALRKVKELKKQNTSLNHVKSFQDLKDLYPSDLMLLTPTPLWDITDGFVKV